MREVVVDRFVRARPDEIADTLDPATVVIAGGTATRTPESRRGTLLTRRNGPRITTVDHEEDRIRAVAVAPREADSWGTIQGLFEHSSH